MESEPGVLEQALLQWKVARDKCFDPILLEPFSTMIIVMTVFIASSTKNHDLDLFVSGAHRSEAANCE